MHAGSPTKRRNIYQEACAPLLAAFAVIAVTAPAANAVSAKGAIKIVNAAIQPIVDINDGQTAAINRVDDRVTTVVADLTALSNKVDAIVAVATDSLTKLQAALQSPGVGGQLGAAGTALPGSSNAATPTALPTGTIYRQIVLANGTGPFAAANGAPIGARTWVKMPAVTNIYSNNTWVCTSAGKTGKVAGGALDSQVDCPAGTSST